MRPPVPALRPFVQTLWAMDAGSQGPVRRELVAPTGAEGVQEAFVEIGVDVAGLRRADRMR